MVIIVMLESRCGDDGDDVMMGVMVIVLVVVHEMITTNGRGVVRYW